MSVEKRERWQSVCSKCGKGGSVRTCYERPRTAPLSIGGSCPNSSDKKHKPRWVKVS